MDSIKLSFFSSIVNAFKSVSPENQENDNILKIVRPNDMLMGCESNLGYPIISQLAEKLAQDTGIRSLESWEELFNDFGFKISYINLNSWKENENLLIVHSKTNMELYLPSFTDQQLNKVYMARALGHYILHAQEGNKPSYYTHSDKNAVNQEALWFGLSVLLPDQDLLFILKSQAKMDYKIIANIFNVPENIIEIKNNILRNQYSI